VRIIAAFAAMLIAPAWSQEPKLSEKETQAWNYVQEELSACAAYFNVAKTCAPEDAKEDELNGVIDSDRQILQH
jgi:gas vesicle protein